MSKNSLFKPEKGTIISKKTLAENDKLFEIELDNGRKLNHEPGQFVQVFVPGVGEAPISVTSSPTKEGPFELCIRAVGNVTNAVHQMEEGDKIGIRGPYGNGFDVEFLEGKDIIMIGGGLGLAPLRSLINYVLDKNGEFGETTVLYGCKRPCEVLFAEEINRWTESCDIDCRKTVDVCPEGVCWEGNVGVITTLIPDVNFDPETTYAAICGPPIMYKFVMEELDKAGLPEDHRFISLERRMRCGIGECGHCQINNLYVCQDGPVFNYAEIKNLGEAL